MLQIRPIGGAGNDAPYCPARDLVNCFNRICQVTAYCLNPDSWAPWIHEYAEKSGLELSDLTEAARSIARFIEIARDPDITDPNDAIRKSGFFDLPMPARVVWMATLGDVATMAYWTSSRDALRVGEKPVGLDDFKQVLQENWSAVDRSR